ncbi:MAG: hypothetical protein KH135_05170 [Firmicutes bacterium]|nr:hypothetical protein [Bacillota bacterium]
MNQNNFQKPFIGRRDPQLIRDENANRMFQNRMKDIHKQPEPAPQPVNYIQKDLKERQRDMRIIRENNMNRKGKPF